MIRKVLFVSFFIIYLLASTGLSGQGIKTSLNLMPYPENVIIKEGKFRLDSNFTIGITGNPDKRIYPYASRVLRRLDNKTVILVKQGYLDSSDNDLNASFVINCVSPGKVVMGMDEYYSLNVTTKKIELKSPTDIGALRGMETFLQLVSKDEKGYFIPCVEITDKPRFPWRGLLIDACRHFYPVDQIKHNIDGMAAVKMNVLHFHLSEDQGFRVECKTYPKLHILGSNGLYYSQEQIRDIINYASDRGIRVVPEFDMPGHSTSWFVGYPELASLPGPYNIGNLYGIFRPSMDPVKKYTYKFLAGFIKEMAELFPDEYFHIGGDENDGENWDKSQSIQDFMKKEGIKTNDELQKYFNQKILNILTKNNKKMMGWDEIFQPNLPKDIMIQSWRGKDYMINAAKQSYQTILSNGYYIDLAKSTKDHYLNDPLPDTVKLDEQQKKFILGGEATMWSEITCIETVDSRIWPRTAAIAERLWSPSYVKDVDDMYRRLDIIEIQLEELELTHIKNREMMMRRLVGNDSIEPLKIFISAVEPWKGYKRHSYGINYTTTTPLSRVADIASPDEAVARRFRKNVDDFIAKPSDSLKKLIVQQLQSWNINHTKLTKLINEVPALGEIYIVSSCLSDISAVGIEAITAIDSKTKMTADWKEKSLQSVAAAKKPLAEIEIAILPAIEKLLNAVDIK